MRRRITSSVLTGLLVLGALASVAQAQTRGGFDAKGHMTMHGTPRFVLGVYDSGGSYSTNPAQWEQQIFSPAGERGLQGFGLNVYLNYWLGNMPIDPTNALLDVLHNHGMMYLQTGNCFDTGGWQRYGANSFSIMSQSYVQQFAQHPAALGYYVMDECVDSLIAETTSHQQQLKSWDPQGVTFAANLAAGYRNPALWTDAADIMGTDPYPLYGPEPAAGYTHFSVADYVSKLRAVAKPDRPVWSVLQFFKFTSDSRVPTADELRAHAVMSIVEGAQGIFWWDVGSNGIRSGTDAATVSAAMSNLKTLTNELAGLEPALLADAAPGALVGNSTKFANPIAGRIGQLTHNIAVEWLYSRKAWYQEELTALLAGDTSKSGGLVNGAANVRTLTKIVNGVGYVFAYNYTNGQQPATFTWQSAPGSVKESKTGQTFQVSGSSWSDTFGPYQARIYVVNGAGQAPPTPPPSGEPLALSFTNPASGSTVSATATVSMNATGGSGYNFAVTVDGAPVYAGTNPSFSWNTSGVTDGARTLAATVTDAQNRTATASRSVVVSNTTTTPPPAPPPPPPTGNTAFAVSFSYPATGSVVNGSQTVGLSTTATWGQAKTITLSVDGTVITSESVTGTTLWHSWDTGGVPDGTRTLTASVTMNGQTATATLPVKVANRGIFLNLGVGSTGLRVGQTTSLSASITNPGAAVSVDVYVGVLLPSAAGPGLGCPRGDAVAFVTEGSSALTVRCASASPATFPRFSTGTSIPTWAAATTMSDFFALAWPSSSAGADTVFMALTAAGALADGTIAAGDVIAFDTRTVTIAD
jgi:hypothetical protein